MLLELELDMLRDEVDGHDIVTPLPGDDDVCVPPRGPNELIKRGLHGEGGERVRG